MKATDAFWRDQLPAGQQSTLLPLVSGKWVKAYASNKDFKDLADVLDRDSFISSLANGDPVSKYVNLGRSTVGSTPTVRLKDTKDGSTVDVAATGPALPLRALPGTADGPGSAIFSDWNTQYSATEPPQSEVYDLSQLLGP